MQFERLGRAAVPPVLGVDVLGLDEIAGARAAAWHADHSPRTIPGSPSSVGSTPRSRPSTCCATTSSPRAGDPHAGFYDLGVYPRYKANLSGRWAHPGGASVGFLLRYVGSYQECAGDDCNTPRNLATAHAVDRYVKLDLFGGYDLPSWLGRTTLQVGVNNAFDAAPPVVYNAPSANSDATTYDFVGRMIYLRMSQLF